MKLLNLSWYDLPFNFFIFKNRTSIYFKYPILAGLKKFNSLRFYPAKIDFCPRFDFTTFMNSSVFPRK